MKLPSKDLQDLLDQAVGEYCFSGYQFVAQGKGDRTALAGGHDSFWPGAAPVTHDSLFDIGSVTKALCTVSLLARWADRGGDLDRCPREWFPEWKASWAKLPLTAFLEHSSGLKPWVAFPGGSVSAWLAQQGEAVVAGAPSKESRYSDLNFWILGLIAEKVFGGTLTEAFEHEVTGPLGLKARFGPEENAVATEYHLSRGGLLRGVVFDDNCAAMGGVGGHAGLFASGESVERWAQEWLRATLGRSQWLGEETAKRFVRKTNTVPGSTWALGWDTKSPQGSTCGTRFSSDSFGHLGYPGASVWIDPQQGWTAVLLTNRVHPSRVDERIRQIRPEAHDRWAATQKEKG